MERIRVLNILHSINLGGGAKNVLAFCRNTPSQAEYNVCALKEQGDKYNDAKKQLPFVFCANGNLDEVKKYIQKNQINILHFYTRGYFTDLEFKLASFAKQEKLKIVNTNIFGEYSSEHQKLVDANIFKSKHCLMKYIKNSGLNYLSDIFFEANFVIPNPVDFEYMHKLITSEIEVITYKKNLNIHEGDFIIGKIGSRKALEKWNNLLLYMFPLVLKKYPKTVMLLQGVPDSRLSWVKKFGDRIRVLEETSDDKELALRYSILDVFTHASKIGEHSGNSINDAMFFKKPVIMNITPNKDNGQLEQIENNKSGYLTNSAMKYANYVCELLENPLKRKMMGKNAYEFVKKNNDVKKLSQDLLNVYLSFFSNQKFHKYSIPRIEILDYKKKYPIMLSNLLRKNNFETKYKIKEFFYKLTDYYEQNY